MAASFDTSSDSGFAPTPVFSTTIGAYVVHRELYRTPKCALLEVSQGETRALLLSLPSVESLREQAERIRALPHDGLLRVHEVWTADARLMVAMERVEGVRLRDLIERRPVGAGSIVPLCLRITEVLKCVHRGHLTVPALSPDTLFLEHSGRLVFAGLVVGLIAEAEFGGGLLGSSGYIAPEVFGGAQVSLESDQYTLGRLFIELCAQRDSEGPEAQAAQEVYASLLPLIERTQSASERFSGVEVLAAHLRAVLARTARRLERPVCPTGVSISEIMRTKLLVREARASAPRCVTLPVMVGGLKAGPDGQALLDTLAQIVLEEELSIGSEDVERTDSGPALDSVWSTEGLPPEPVEEVAALWEANTTPASGIEAFADITKRARPFGPGVEAPELGDVLLPAEDADEDLDRTTVDSEPTSTDELLESSANPAIDELGFAAIGTALEGQKIGSADVVCEEPVSMFGQLPSKAISSSTVARIEGLIDDVHAAPPGRRSQTRVLELEPQRAGLFVWALVGIFVGLGLGITVRWMTWSQRAGDIRVVAPIQSEGISSFVYSGDAPGATDRSVAQQLLSDAQVRLQARDFGAAERLLGLCIRTADLSRCHRVLGALLALRESPGARFHLNRGSGSP